MGGPTGIGSFKPSVIGPMENPSFGEAGGTDAQVRPQSGQEAQIEQHPAPKLSPHEAFVNKVFAEAAKIADANQQKNFFDEINNVVNQKGPGIDEQLRKAIDQGCKDVNKFLNELDQLTGRQIVECGRSGNENIVRTLCDAMVAHTKLADLLMEASNIGADKDRALSEQGKAFMDQAIRLNQRVCTISKLIAELNAVQKKGGAGAETLERTHQSGRLGEITVRDSEAGKELRQQLEAIAQKVDSLPVLKKLSDNQEITDEEIADAKKLLDDLAGELNDVAEKKAEDPAAQNLIKAACEVLTRAHGRLDQTDFTKLAKKAAKDVTKLFTLPGKDDVESIRFPETADMDDTDKALSKICKQYDACVNIAADLRKQTEKFANEKVGADAPDGELKNLEDAIRSLHSCLNDAKKIIANQSNPDKVILGSIDEIRKAFSPDSKEMAQLVEALDHLKQLVGQNRKLDGHVLKRVLDDPEAFSAVVEARVRGVDPSLIDFDLSSGRLLKDPEKLGNGAFSSAYKCTFGREDGTVDVRVFKPDGDATRGIVGPRAGVIRDFGGMDKNQRAINLNFMAHEVAEMLGSGHTVCKSSAGFINGRFGFLMEAAPGIDSCDMEDLIKGAKSKDPAKAKESGEQKIGEMKVSEYLNLPSGKPTREHPVTKTTILAQVAQQLNQLQWTDAITGQLDRHVHNYKVDISKEGKVTIKGFDNDQCGAAQMVGIGKVKITDMNLFSNQLASSLKKRLSLRYEAQGVNEAQKCIAEIVKDVEGFSAENGWVIDVSKLKSASQLRTLIYGTGLRSVAPPTYMDRGVYDNLERLTKGVELVNNRYEGGELKAFREKLTARGMTDEQVEAAVARLMEAWNIAEDLKSKGMVYSLHELEDEKALMSIVNNDRHLELDGSAKKGDANLRGSVRSFGTNYFNRLQFMALVPQEWVERIDN